MYRNPLLLSNAQRRSWARLAFGPPERYFTPRSLASVAGRRLRAARYRSSTIAASLLPLRISLATRPFESATASEIVLPFTRFSACGRLKSERRSHSHDDSRNGRPNTSRNPALPI